MEAQNKKCLKKTSFVQFQKLVDMMEEFLQLATGSLSFGCNKIIVEQRWDSVAEKLNSFGPPMRNGQEWKRIWHDQKCRVKRKIGDNNKSINGTGGGPCVVNNLTELELQIDRICHLSSAAAPSGKVLGLPSVQKPSDLLTKNKPRFLQAAAPSVKVSGLQSAQKPTLVTPPRSKSNVAVVTPTTSKQSTHETQYEHLTDIFTPNISNIITVDNSPPKTLPYTYNTSKQISSSTPKQTILKKSTEPPHQNRKRKHNEKNTDKEKLLRQQTEIQRNTLDNLNRQLEASIINAESAKIQAEAAKIQAEASKIQAEASKQQAIALKEIADSAKVMAQALVGIINHLKDED